jgi:hypothetical protein
VLSELLNDVLLSAFMASKQQQTAGVTIETMHGEESRQLWPESRMRSASRMPCNQSGNNLVQCWLLASSLWRPTPFRATAQCHHARWFFHNHNVTIDESNYHVVRTGWQGQSSLHDRHGFTAREASSFIQTEDAVDGHTPRLQQLPHGRP